MGRLIKCVGLMLGLSVLAGPCTGGNSLADRLQKKLADVGSLHTSFMQLTLDSGGQIVQSSEGELWLKSGDQSAARGTQGIRSSRPAGRTLRRRGSHASRASRRARRRERGSSGACQVARRNRQRRAGRHERGCRRADLGCRGRDRRANLRGVDALPAHPDGELICAGERLFSSGFASFDFKTGSFSVRAVRAGSCN